MSETKISRPCKTCHWYNKKWTQTGTHTRAHLHSCSRPVVYVDCVLGMKLDVPLDEDCYKERISIGIATARCGPTGKYWKPKA